MLYFNAPLCNFNLQSVTSYHIHYHTSAVFFIWIQRTTFIKWLIPDWVTTLWRVRINNVGIIFKKKLRQRGRSSPPAGRRVSSGPVCVCVCVRVCVCTVSGLSRSDGSDNSGELSQSLPSRQRSEKWGRPVWRRVRQHTGALHDGSHLISDNDINCRLVLIPGCESVAVMTSPA